VKSEETTTTLEVKFGGAVAKVRPRADGLWAVRWREARKPRSTTAVSKEKALARAKEIVRGLASGQGGRMMTIEEAELVERLKRLAGDRHPASVLSLLEDVVTRHGGIGQVERALRFWESSGMGAVKRVKLKQARDEFLDEKEGRSVWTLGGLRKELDSLWKAMPELDVCDVSEELLEAWVRREKGDGYSPSVTFVNNRLDTWGNFFNWCRHPRRNYWPKGEKHPAEMIVREEESRRAVPIWTPQTAHGMLAMAKEHLPRQVPYVVIGCWLGLRPTEVTRLEWRHFDWARRYVHLDLDVAQKLGQERFVPLNDKAFALLEEWLRGRGLWEEALAGELQDKCCLIHDREMLSLKGREMGIITGWEQDVMRHSWISYMIAAGNSKHQVAEWAGNSERIILQRYRRPLMREDGERWFQWETFLIEGC
jgi:integrase